MYNNTMNGVLKEVYLQPGIHKRGLSKRLKLGMPSIDYAIKKLGFLLIKKKSGNQINYYLDYSKEALTSALNSVEYSRLEKLPHKIRLTVYSFLEELKEKPIIAALFGSYAKGDYDKDSDLDIVLVFQKLNNSKEIENTARKCSSRTGVQVNPVYLDYLSFKESVHNSTKDFFKNFKKNKIIITGMEWWRQLNNEEA